jgi:hypothetical protein
MELFLWLIVFGIFLSIMLIPLALAVGGLVLILDAISKVFRR